MLIHIGAFFFISFVSRSGFFLVFVGLGRPRWLWRRLAAVAGACRRAPAPLGASFHLLLLAPSSWRGRQFAAITKKNWRL